MWLVVHPAAVVCGHGPPGRARCGNAKPAPVTPHHRFAYTGFNANVPAAFEPDLKGHDACDSLNLAQRLRLLGPRHRQHRDGTRPGAGWEQEPASPDGRKAERLPGRSTSCLTDAAHTTQVRTFLLLF